MPIKEVPLWTKASPVCLEREDHATFSSDGANTATTRELGKAARANMSIERVEARGIERVEERDRGVKPGGTRAVSPKISKSLKLSLRGSVEIQAQHRPDWLKKPRTESVGTDRIGRFCVEKRDDAMMRRKIFREEYILGLV